MQLENVQQPRYQMVSCLHSLIFTEAIPGQSSWHLMVAHFWNYEHTQPSFELGARWECFRIIAQLPHEAIPEALENLKELDEYYAPVHQLPNCEPKVSIIPVLPGTIMQRPAIDRIVE